MRSENSNSNQQIGDLSGFDEDYSDTEESESSQSDNQSYIGSRHEYEDSNCSSQTSDSESYCLTDSETNESSDSESSCSTNSETNDLTDSETNDLTDSEAKARNFFCRTIFNTI